MSFGGHEERLTLEDTGKTAVFKLCEGNPGALNVLMQLVMSYEKIDPDSVFGNLSGLLSLDTYGIYGPRIWMLYKDVCGESIINMIAVLRAVQLGKLDLDRLDGIIDGKNFGGSSKLDMDEILATVQQQLPGFGRVK